MAGKKNEIDPIAGMTKMICTNSITTAALAFLETEAPVCPFHDIEMQPTKYFGLPK